MAVHPLESQTPAPAHRIRTERLILRCWELRDAPLLKQAIEASLAHLRPWMLWVAQEPEPLEAKQSRIQSYRKAFREGGDFVYGLFDPDETRVLGAGGLHERISDGGREIGYWIRSDSLRLGYATEMAAALTRVSFELAGLERVEIHCDPRNIASSGVPRRLGFTHVRTLCENQHSPDGTLRDTMVWRLEDGDYSNSSASRVQLEAFSKSGSRLLVGHSDPLSRSLSSR